ncbi:MAG: hypothetical protein KC729_16390 [Candidatus Eisenbacteria bacterium]|uniref:Uncharacterized protein n=1 Tax=Eiseniibacteriota bacterium TaxID=2212470 RepID=A0A956RQH0_UNCEI|nr:hypothetical protein [Candidatus Eisenbacteria bacterium]
MTKHTSPSQWRNRAGATTAVAAALGLMILTSGCSDSESQTSALTGVSATQAAETTAPSLSLSQLPASMNLTTTQQTQLGEAIDQLNSDRQRLHSEFQRGPRGGGRFGDRIRRTMGANAEPPMVTFLESSSEILDADQFQTLCEYLVSNRPERGQGGEGIRHEGRGRMMGHLASELGLSDQQVSAMQDLMKSYGEQFRTLMESVLDGTVSAEDGVAQATQLAESLKGEMAGILTPDQLAKWEELKQDRIDQGIDRRLENLDTQLTRRAEFLTRVLQLSDAQSSQVEQILLASIPARERILTGVQNGTIPPQVAIMMGLQIEQQILTDIKAILTDEQIQKLEAMKDLIPHGMKMAGRGHGFGGGF